MGITIVEDRGLLCPKIRCDTCEEVIEDATKANVLWERGVMEPTSLRFVHRRCDFAAGSREESVTGRRSYWRNLNDFINQLTHPDNLRTKPLVED